jgi:hypothetical protein
MKNILMDRIEKGDCIELQSLAGILRLLGETRRIKSTDNLMVLLKTRAGALVSGMMEQLMCEKEKSATP